MLVHPHRAQAIVLLRESGLLSQVLPEIADVVGQTWDELLSVLQRLDQPSLAVVLAAILRVRPECRVGSAIAERWRLPKRDAERADWLLDQIGTFFETPSCPWPRLQRLLLHPGARELINLAAAITSRDHPAVRLWEEKLGLEPHVLNPAPLVTGSDLLNHGIPAGRRLGELLEAIRDAQLEGEIDSPQKALAMAEQLYLMKAEGH